MPTAETDRPKSVPNWLPGAILFGLALAWVSACGAAATPTLDFLYIDSAVDDAAGGHTAVRLDGNVFHYQYYSNGLFLMVNDPWEGFRFRYNDLQNRSVTLTRVPLSRESYDRIRSHFLTRFVQQEHRLLLLDQLTEEQRLLQRLAAGEDSLALAGLGLFSPARTGDPRARELNDLVADTLGASWLAGRVRAVTAELERRPFDETTPSGWSVRLHELLSLREALVLLGEARDLADDALLTAEGNGGPLSERERTAGEEYLRELGDSVLGLLASDRPDRGTSLLLQMARYQALGRSLDTGALVTLDPFSDGAQTLSPAAAGVEHNSGGGLIREATDELAAFREAFVFDAGLRGTAYSRIETAQGRLSELERAQRLGHPVRVEEGFLQPSRSQGVRTGVRGTTEDFSQGARAAAASRDQHRSEVERAYRYNLLTRNCVTELIRDVNESFETPEQGQELMGGTIAPGEKLSFIPFRLTAAIRAAFPFAETETLPSYRLRQLERLYERKGPLVWWRENNTLTSTLYTKWWAEDSVFLFFTDDVVAPRPLLGTLNLLFATAHAAGGLLLAPLDHGELLARSLRGMLYSLPEIAFFNIRKGSFRTVPDLPELGR